MSGETTVFLEAGPDGGHRWTVGRMTVLERRLRTLARDGVRRALVSSLPLPLPTDLPIAVEWHPPGEPAPAGLPRQRADECAGVLVVDEASRLCAERALCRSLAKSHQGLIDALVNWRLSMPLTRALSRTRVQPTEVTMAAIVVGLAAVALVVRGSRPAAACAGILLQLQSVLDSSDGELARLTYRCTRVGQWLDNVSDDVIDNLFIAAAGLAAGGAWRYVGLAGALGRALTEAVAYHEVFRTTGTGDVYAFRLWFDADKASIAEVYDPRSWRTWVRAVGRRDTYVFLWMLCCLGGAPHVVALYGAVLGAVQAAFVSIHVVMRPPLAARTARAAQ